MDILTSGESLWEVRAAFGWRFQLDAETLCFLFGASILKGARCATLGRFELWRMSGSRSWFGSLSFFRSLWILSGGARWKTGCSHREARQKGDRVSVGTRSAWQLRRVFARIQGWLAENSPSLPLECSVRGGKARDARALYTLSGTIRQRKKRKWVQ